MATVDTSLHPHTTGRAAAYASQHSAPHPLVLYGGWFCPFVQRAWIVLHELGVAHQYVEINPYAKDAAFLALNPRGLVPTLAVPTASAGADTEGDQQQKKRPLYESVVVCEYLDDVYGAGEKSLYPRDAYEKARARLAIDHVASRVVPAFYRFMQHTDARAYSLADARSEFLGHLKTFIRDADPDGPYYLGQRFSMVDVVVAPWLARLWLFDVYKGGVGVPEPGCGGDDEEVWSRWRRWADAVLRRDSVQDTLSDREQYVEAYRRYAEDTTQSGVAKATREGRVLP